MSPSAAPPVPRRSTPSPLPAAPPRNVAMPHGAGDEAAAEEEVPAAGMEFASPEEARAFYCAYASRAGFRVRSSKSFASRIDDAIIMRRFVCTRQGLPSRKDTLDASKKRRNRASARAGCPAMLQVNRRPGPAAARWVVSRCVLDHSHPLAAAADTGSPGEPSNDPSRSRPLQLAQQEGGGGNVDPSFHRAAALAPGGGVAQGLLDHFRKMQLDNPAFCYAVQLDGSGCVANFVWVDARARSLYRWFGDAVVLDLTCRRNRHAVPFAALTGANHHRQVIVFGYALMTDESEDSFAWLFETWLAFMGGKKPMSFTMGYNRAY